jgi:hypothetical protein
MFIGMKIHQLIQKLARRRGRPQTLLRGKWVGKLASEFAFVCYRYP